MLQSISLSIPPFKVTAKHQFYVCTNTTHFFDEFSLYASSWLTEYLT